MTATVQHPRCGKTWTGLKAEHCADCCETFSGTRAGDRHRRAGACHPPASAGLEFDERRQLWRFPTGSNPWA